MSEEPDTTCAELDELLDCSDSVLNLVIGQITSCAIAEKIGRIALLRIACETGQTCQFDSLTVDGVTCGGDDKIRRLINIVKCMQQICADVRKAEHICERKPKRSMFRRSRC